MRVCWTTRASLVTGLYPRYPRPHLTTNMVTLGEVLKQAGYQTALSGKWHLGRTETTHPVYRGFEDYYGLLDGCCNFFDPYYRDPKYKWGSSGGGYRFFAKTPRGSPSSPMTFTRPMPFTDHAIKQIKGYAENRPAFLSASLLHRGLIIRCTRSRKTSRSTKAVMPQAGKRCGKNAINDN